MSTRDWKLGEVVYLKSGSPAMTVVGTDSHGVTKVQWYDPQAAEVERSMYPTVVFPKDCLTEAEVPVRIPSSDLGIHRVPQLQAEPIRLVAPQPSTEELRQLILETLNGWIRDTKREPVQATQTSEKIVEAGRAAEQRSEQVTAQATAARTEPARNEQRQSVLDPAQASGRHNRKNS